MNVRKTDGCWDWCGTVSHGYGVLYLGSRGNRKSVGAHRVSWEIHKGQIPDGLWVLHACDNPPCCNPEHLFLGTNADNIADMNAKGRARGGSLKENGNPSAKISRREAEIIKELNAPERQIAVAFGVSKQLVGAIRRGEVWQSITLPRGYCNRPKP